jgi:hypothetical protein
MGIAAGYTTASPILQPPFLIPILEMTYPPRKNTTTTTTSAVPTLNNTSTTVQTTTTTMSETMFVILFFHLLLNRKRYAVRSKDSFILLQTTIVETILC